MLHSTIYKKYKIYTVVPYYVHSMYLLVKVTCLNNGLLNK